MASLNPLVYEVKQYLLDTRTLWPTEPSAPAKVQMQKFESIASDALSLLPSPASRAAILRYHHPRDARMSLGSALLKHYVISTLVGVPWSQSLVSRAPVTGKPIYIPPVAVSSSGSTAPDPKGIEFNISHQGGLVCVLACCFVSSSPTRPQVGGDTLHKDRKECERIELGTDIVLVNERNDYARIASSGLFTFIDMHADVFSPSEISALKLSSDGLRLPSSTFSPPISNSSSFPSSELQDSQLKGYARTAISRVQYGDQPISWSENTPPSRMGGMGISKTTHTLDPQVVVAAKLRRFYALWCLREAYVKMTGEALLAPWLAELVFRRFDVPLAASPRGTEADIEESDDKEKEEWGDTTTDFDIAFKGNKVTDAKMELRAWGADFMLSSAARIVGPAGDGEDAKERMRWAGWEFLDLRDVYAAAGSGAEKS